MVSATFQNNQWLEHRIADRMAVAPQTSVPEGRSTHSQSGESKTGIMNDVTVPGDFEFPEPWWDLRVKRSAEDHQRESMKRQIELELEDGHPLNGRVDGILARCQSCDEVLIGLRDGTRAHIHLVWKGKQTKPWPLFEIFESFEETSKYVDDHAQSHGF